MKIIQPATVTDDILISHSVPEIPPDEYNSSITYSTGDLVLVASTWLVYKSLQDSNTGNDPATSPTYWEEIGEAGPPEYSSGTTYSIGDQVVVVATHKIYESLQDSNTGNYPPDNIDGVNPFWLEVSASNPWKAFDGKISSNTSCCCICGGTINYELYSNGATGVALFGLKGLRVDLTLTDPSEGEVYSSSTELLSTSNVYDWYTYFFEEFLSNSDLVKLDLPPYQNATLSVSIIPEEGTEVAVGELVFGKVRILGITQHSPEFSIVDYSRKTTDIFGNFQVLQRPFAKKNDFRIIIENGAINTVTRILSTLRATPLVWIATENDLYESTFLTYGFYKDFRVVIPHPVWAECTLQIEGLI